MPGHLEPLSAVLRIGGVYGEPYTWAAAVRYRSPTEVEILGASRCPTGSEWKAAIRVLRTSGVRLMRFSRRHPKTGKWRVHLWRL